MAALCSNDVKSCYNQLDHLDPSCPVPLQARSSSYGDSKKHTLAALRHCIQMASDNKGPSDWTNPIAGIGQGENGAST